MLDWLDSAEPDVVCLQELTLSPYFAITPDGPSRLGIAPADLAREHGLSTQAVRNYESDGFLPAAERTASDVARSNAATTA